jgi:hypothetical protein
MSSTSAKETVYVDVDDEITTIIDKVIKAKGKIVALVLPKRASVLQSIVNIKLLKRSADTAQKNLVLVTSETGLLPLAGVAGLHVASTPSSKPYIPDPPQPLSTEPDSVEEPLESAPFGSDEFGDTPDDEFDPDAAANKPVGELAGLGAAAAGPALAQAKPPITPDAPEEIVLDDEDPELAATSATAAATTKPNVQPVKKNKKLAVPNFTAFRLWLALGVLAVCLLVAGWIVATKVLPTAQVQIATNSQMVGSTLNLTLDTAAKTADVADSIIPAVAQTSQKTLTQQVPATGQQNNGEKASGTVKFSVTRCAPNLDAPADIVVGSSVSAAGKTYITQEKGSYDISGPPSGSCIKYSTNTMDIAALKAGADYNLASGTSFSGPASVSGTGSASGGTDVIVKVVSQSDIDNAKTKLTSQDAAAVKTELQTALQAKGTVPIPSTLVTSEPQLTTSAKAGETAETVTATAVMSYTMLGIRQNDLRTLVVAAVDKKIDADKQKILDDGVSKATFSQQTPGSTNTAVVTAKVQSVAGPELEVETLKRQIAGKKSGDVKQALGQLPGVTEVTVSYRPFWVTTAPKNTQKITVNIAQPKAQ